MDLAQQICGFYLGHIGELPAEKQFHFASRLGAWTGDETAQSIVRRCRSALVPEPADAAHLQEVLAKLIARNQADHPLVARELRRPYLERYAPLYGLELAVFRAHHWAAVYGLDGRAALLGAMPGEQLRAMQQRLLADDGALRILSSIAVNYLYLMPRLAFGEEPAIRPEHILALASGYDRSDPEQLRLLVYLLTHSIIAATGFYQTQVPAAGLTAYRRMLGQLEALLQGQYDNFSLDTKLEFLVCCRICTYDTELTARIWEECAASLSPDGAFLIDSHNAFAGKPARNTFEASEHRNILYIMGTTPYEPHAVSA